MKGTRQRPSGAPEVKILSEREIQSKLYGSYLPTRTTGASVRPQSPWTGSEILTGELEMRVGYETYTLRAGDRDFLPANTMHSAFVPGNQPVIYLIGAKH